MPIKTTTPQVVLGRTSSLSIYFSTSAILSLSVLICAESLCCGTPVVGFEAGGPEQVALNEYSLWGKWGDVALLKNAIVKMLEATNDAKSIRTQAINRYAISVMADEYMKLYKTM